MLGNPNRASGEGGIIMRRLALAGLAAGAAGAAAIALTVGGGTASASSTQSSYPWHGQAPTGSATSSSSSSRTASDSGTKETIVLIAHQTNFAFFDANNDHKFNAPDYFVFREKDK